MSDSIDFTEFNMVEDQVWDYIEKLFSRSGPDKHDYYMPTNSIDMKYYDAIKICKKRELLQEIIYLTAILLNAKQIKASDVHDDVLDYINTLKHAVLQNVSLFNVSTFKNFPYYKSKASVDMIKRYLHVAADTYKHHTATDVTNFLRDLYKSDVVWRVFFPNLFETELHKWNVIAGLDSIFKPGPIAKLNVAMNGANSVIKKNPPSNFNDWILCDPFSVRLYVCLKFKKCKSKGHNAFGDFTQDVHNSSLQQYAHVPWSRDINGSMPHHTALVSTQTPPTDTHYTQRVGRAALGHKGHESRVVMGNSSNKHSLHEVSIAPRQHQHQGSTINGTTSSVLLSSSPHDAQPVSNRNNSGSTSNVIPEKSESATNTRRQHGLRGRSAWGEENDPNPLPSNAKTMPKEGPLEGSSNWAQRRQQNNIATTSSDLEEVEDIADEVAALNKPFWGRIPQKFKAPE